MIRKYFDFRKNEHSYIAVTEIVLYVSRWWWNEYTALVNVMGKVGMRPLFVLIYFWFFVCFGFTLPCQLQTYEIYPFLT